MCVLEEEPGGRPAENLLVRDETGRIVHNIAKTAGTTAQVLTFPCVPIGDNGSHYQEGAWQCISNCPSCKVLYHLIKAEAGPETIDREINCGACGAPFPGQEESFVLKYFLFAEIAAS